MSNTNNTMQTQTSNTLYNAIMEAGGKDLPPMLAPDKTVPVFVGSFETTTETYMENYKNVSQDIRDQLNAKAEAVQIIITRIDNDIYSTVDACPNACEMWKAIERTRRQLESDAEMCMFALTVSRTEPKNIKEAMADSAWIESMQVELHQFDQLESQELKTVSYHKLYDILKQHQNEVNELKAERIARDANPLALVAQQQPVYHPQNYPTHYTHNSSTRSQQAATRNRGKAIVNSLPPIYDQEPSMVTEDDEMSKDKEINKLMALISLSFKKIYKPTNNNLQTSSNTSRDNQDNSLRINRGDGYDNKRLGNVAGARETVGTTVVQKSGIQCYNCKEFRHVAMECQKPKKAKDAAYHREKMILCKQEEAGIQLNAEQADWRDDTDDESEDQELEAHYMYMAQIQEVTPDVAADSGPIFDTEKLQKLIEIILFIVNSRCSKHITRNLKLLTNFVEKFLGTVKFGNYQIAPILSYGDLGNDLLTGSRGTDLYSITLQDTTSPTPICLMAKATSSQAWLWHRILHQTSVARTPEQNSVVKRRNRTLVEAGRTMLSTAKVPLFFWAEAIATTWYSTHSRAYRVFNKRTRVIVETIHVNFDELPQMVSDHVSSDPIPQCQSTALEHDILSPGLQCQKNVSHADKSVTTSNELDLLFSLMFDELLYGSTQVVSKPSAVTTADAPNQRQQQNTTLLNTQSTPNPTCQVLTQAPTVTSTENINQVETISEYVQGENDEFINIFSTPVQGWGEMSSRHVDSSNMHTFYQRHPSEHRWTKDHPLEQVIRNPSQSVRTRRQLESDGEMCMFALTVSQTELKYIKEAMADSAWIESMQEELHQFDRLDV
nr:retrovirus-related Pol polyprotein from transposon TNT 1-94 [Tanacetum cinerariifolium]